MDTILWKEKWAHSHSSHKFRTCFYNHRAKEARTVQGSNASKVNHCQQKHKHLKCSLFGIGQPKSTIGSDYISVVFSIKRALDLASREDPRAAASGH